MTKGSIAHLNPLFLTQTIVKLAKLDIIAVVKHGPALLVGEQAIVVATMHPKSDALQELFQRPGSLHVASVLRDGTPAPRKLTPAPSALLERSA